MSAASPKSCFTPLPCTRCTCRRQADSATHSSPSQVTSPEFDFGVLTNNIRQYIKSLNFKSRSSLVENGATYKNHLAAFLNPKTIVSTANQEAMKEFLKTGRLQEGNFETWGRLTRIQKAHFGDRGSAIRDERG